MAIVGAFKPLKLRLQCLLDEVVNFKDLPQSSVYYERANCSTAGFSSLTISSTICARQTQS